MMSLATEQMVLDLKKIMKESFGDPDDYIDSFFKNRFKPQWTYVYSQDNKPVSMLMLLPAGLYLKGEYKPVSYVYAVATLPEYRSKGISTALMDYAVNETRCEISATFLRPAEESLFNFYGRQGYKTSFFMKEASLNAEDMREIDFDDFTLSDASPEEYKRIRDAAFEAAGYINWDLEAIQYALAEISFPKGGANIVESGAKREIILYRAAENKLYVKETTITDERLLLAVIKNIMENSGAYEAFVRLHPESPVNIGTVESFAMIKGEVGSMKGYLNLVLD